MDHPWPFPFRAGNVPPGGPRPISLRVLEARPISTHIRSSLFSALVQPRLSHEMEQFHRGLPLAPGTRQDTPSPAPRGTMQGSRSAGLQVRLYSLLQERTRAPGLPGLGHAPPGSATASAVDPGQLAFKTPPRHRPALSPWLASGSCQEQLVMTQLVKSAHLRHSWTVAN